ncbi:MAG: glycerophosphodiester phosphodiesterase [Actinobacteria bacterium]|nr:glycerophosphodiester phosphodiesterase [Actinomycetota bacterium]
MRVRRDGGPLLEIGHRGAAALAPPNSLRALELALEAGVDIVEFDVLGQPGRGLVLSHSSRELGPDPLPLDDALAFLAQQAPVGLLADVKNSGYERELVEAIRRHGLVERTLVSTMDLGILGEVRRLEPGIGRSVTYPRNRARAATWRRVPRVLPRRIGALVLRAEAAVATLNYRVVTRSVVERCHDLGAAVFAWTVNDPALVARLDAMGVDGVITDDPSVFQAIFQT